MTQAKKEEQTVNDLYKRLSPENKAIFTFFMSYNAAGLKALLNVLDAVSKQDQ